MLVLEVLLLLVYWKWFDVLDGELEYRGDGIFIKARTYIHPETGKIIKTVGCNHDGPKDFFESIRKFLYDCDKVLYEGAGYVDRLGNRISFEDNTGNTESKNLIEPTANKMVKTLIEKYTTLKTRYLKLYKEPEMKDLLQKLENSDLEIACNISFDEYYSLVEKQNSYVLFYNVIDVKNPKWELADIDDKNYWFKEFGKEWSRQFRPLLFKKEEIALDLIVTSLEGISFIKGDVYRKSHSAYLESKLIGSLYTKDFLNNVSVIKDRNKIVKNLLKKRLKDNEIRIIGVTYGAAHMPDLNRFIRSLGFIQKDVKDIKFDDVN